MVIREQRLSFTAVRQVLGSVLGEDLHAKRADSPSDATLGVLRSASLGVCANRNYLDLEKATVVRPWGHSP
jgi:hypothetical protein